MFSNIDIQGGGGGTVKVFGEEMVLRKFSNMFFNGSLMVECGLLVELLIFAHS